MKKLSFCLGLLLIGILLVSSCKSPFDSFIGKSYNEMQERIDSLEERVTELEEILLKDIE